MHKRLYSVYYIRSEFWRELSWGDIVPTRARLHDTHAYLKMCMATDLEDVFVQMQGEIWADPSGSTSELVRSKGLGHTSMSVGDVIGDGTRFWAVASEGFTELQ